MNPFRKALADRHPITNFCIIIYISVWSLIIFYIGLNYTVRAVLDLITSIARDCYQVRDYDAYGIGGTVFVFCLYAVLLWDRVIDDDIPSEPEEITPPKPDAPKPIVTDIRAAYYVKPKVDNGPDVSTPNGLDPI